MAEKKPHIVTRKSFVPTSEYQEWLHTLQHRLRSSQVKAAIKLNTGKLEFYWSLGKDIVEMKAEALWGSGFYNQLSLDLRDMFPSIEGFSVANLRYIKRWYELYSQADIIRQQVVGEFGFPIKLGLVPWGQHIVILTHCKSTGEALYYMDMTIKDGWSRAQLCNEIESGLYQAKGHALTNFKDHLPQPQSALAAEVLKDPYNFDFLTMKKNYVEHDLEEALARNITRFLLELGKGFAYVGRQMELRMPGGQSFFPDMVFYHTKLKCYIILEIKVVPFVPEFAGKLTFYVTAADKLLRDKTDNPSIGLLICKSKDDTVVQWSFENIHAPMGVAAYELNNIIDALPSAEDIENQVKLTDDENA